MFNLIILREFNLSHHQEAEKDKVNYRLDFCISLGLYSTANGPLFGEGRRAHFPYSG